MNASTFFVDITDHEVSLVLFERSVMKLALRKISSWSHSWNIAYNKTNNDNSVKIIFLHTLCNNSGFFYRLDHLQAVTEHQKSTYKNIDVLISGFHRASLLLVTFINQLMHSINTVLDLWRVCAHTPQVQNMPPNNDHAHNKHIWTIICNFNQVQVITPWWWILWDPKYARVIFNAYLLHFCTTEISRLRLC
jgi:hypothetical protein